MQDLAHSHHMFTSIVEKRREAMAVLYFALVLVLSVTTATTSEMRQKRWPFAGHVPVGISSTPSNATVKIGDELSLLCTYSPHLLPRDPRICFESDKKTSGSLFALECLPEGEFVLVEPERVDVRFRYTPSHYSEHGREFGCTGLPGSVTLNLHYKPIIDDIRSGTSDLNPSNSIQLFGSEGDDISLSFNVKANPPASSGNISFSSGSSPHPKVTVTGSSVTLSFNNLRRTNSGKYVARVGNAIGYQDLSFTVIVYYKPIISNIRNNTSDRPYPSDNTWLLGPEGGDFSLSFTVEAHPPVASNVSIVFSTGDPLPTITVTGSSVTLSFINLRRSNGGAYLVRVGNTIGYQDLPFYVYVDYGPVFRNTNTTLVKQVSKHVVLDCSLKEGSSPPSVITFSTTAKDTSNVKWNLQSKKIEVLNTTIGNSGNYTCTASNGYWTTTLIYVLDIICAPIIGNIRNNTSELTYSGYYLNSHLFGNEGDHILLSFTVKAKPPVSTSDIRFLIYSEPLPNITVTGSSVKLSFNNLGRSNAGRYIIKVGNAVGYQILVFKIVVYFGPVFVFTNATILKPVGSYIAMRCFIREVSFPPSVTTFSTTAKDTSNVKWSSKIPIIYVNNATADNVGNYTCTVSNGYWTTTLNYELDIGHKPLISNIRNNTSDRPYPSDSIQLFGYEGDNISLSFTVEAHPPVSGNVSFINGSAPLPNITVTGSSVTLSFNNLRRTNAGAYLIRVGNAIGYQDLPFTVVAYFGPVFRYTDWTFIKQVDRYIVMSCSLKEESFPPSVTTFSTTAKDTSNVKWTPQSKKIEVINTTVGNSGNYTCTASNGYWTITLNYVLDIGHIVNESIISNLSYSEGYLNVTTTYTSPHDESVIFYLVLVGKNYKNDPGPFTPIFGTYKYDHLSRVTSYPVTLSTQFDYWFGVYAHNKYMNEYGKGSVMLTALCFVITEDDEIVFKGDGTYSGSCRIN